MKIQKNILIILIINSFLLFPQTVDIPFGITDGIYTLDLLRVGLDTTATNGIDPHLGEFSIFPGPPGSFLAAFDLYPYVGSQILTFRDYRNAPSFPFTGTKEHKLIWQLTSGATSLTLIYNFSAGVSANLKDPFGGILFNINFADSGSIAVPIPSLFQAILTMYYNNVVPVELNSFTASILHNEKEVELNWTTATETNNSGFEVKRKQVSSPLSTVDNEKWEKVGFVNGFGTTTEPKSYSFTDKDITMGTYKYRLKQIDFDGSFNYSNEIEVEVDFTPKEFVLYQNYPNPFNPNTVIKFAIPKEAKVNLSAYNLLGEKIRELKNEIMQPGNYDIQFDGSELASGMYLYRIQAGEFVQIKKMILTK